MINLALPLPGYEGRYEIYPDGSVVSLQGRYKGKTISQRKGKYGYYSFDVCKDGSPKRVYTHKALAEAFIANPDQLTIVNHKDGNRANNNLDNLEWVSHSQNIAHGFLLKGLKSKNRTSYRLGTLEYINKIHNFDSVEEFFQFLEVNRNNYKLSL